MTKYAKESNFQDDDSSCISVEDFKKIIMKSEKLSESEKNRAIKRLKSKL